MAGHRAEHGMEQSKADKPAGKGRAGNRAGQGMEQGRAWSRAGQKRQQGKEQGRTVSRAGYIAGHAWAWSRAVRVRAVSRAVQGRA
jgi:hypothetical protein